MQRGSEFSLAGAVFGWPPAPGHAAPDGHAPDAWLLLFRDKHATPDPDVLSGLFCSCKSGRDWVLDGAARAVGVTLDTAAEQPPGAWERRITTLRQCLGARGALPVNLTVLCSVAPHSAESVPAVASLPSPSLVITQLTVRDAKEHSNAPPLGPIAGVLHSVVPSLSAHLTTLTLNPCPIPLPSPSILPQLRSLNATLASPGAKPDVSMPASILHSIAPYLAQLHTLEVSEHDVLRGYGSFPWPSLTPPAPSHTLSSFSISSSLTDAVLSLVITHMPALERLGVWQVDLDQDRSHTVWGVRELTISDVYEDYLTRAYRLPRCRPGEHLTVTVPIMLLEVNSEQGLSERLLSRLAEWRIACQTVFVVARMKHSLHPVALRSVLRQLCDTAWPGSNTLCMPQWQWDTDMLREYAQAMPALKEAGFTRYAVTIEGSLTDELLSACLEAGPDLSHLTVRSLALQSDTHANTPWPWEQLRIGTIDDLSQLLRLPNPAGQGSPRDVRCQDMLEIKSTLPVVDTDRLRQWLEHAPDLLLGNTVRLRRAADPSKQASPLRDQLAFLRAIAPDGLRSKGGQTSIGGLMTHDTLNALSGLPEWLGNDLDLGLCLYPLPHTEYTRLAQCIPATYTRWCLGPLNKTLVQSICEGINARGSGKVTVALMGSGQMERVGEHVFLGGRYHVSPPF